jgi:uncharacterized membrane protein HdeD (DUF308 family)
MRPGVGSIVFGVALLGAGITVTLLSHAVVWWGAILVGIYWIVRGIFRVAKKPDPSND